MVGRRIGYQTSLRRPRVDEIGIIESITGDNAPALKLGQVILKIDPRYFRPTEVETLWGIRRRLKIN